MTPPSKDTLGHSGNITGRGAGSRRYFTTRAVLRKRRGAPACQHAKCILVDGVTAFITSANFTESAHERNIELGVLFRENPKVARSIRSEIREPYSEWISNALAPTLNAPAFSPAELPMTTEAVRIRFLRNTPVAIALRINCLAISGTREVAQNARPWSPFHPPLWHPPWAIHASHRNFCERLNPTPVLTYPSPPPAPILHLSRSRPYREVERNYEHSAINH